MLALLVVHLVRDREVNGANLGMVKIFFTRPSFKTLQLFRHSSVYVCYSTRDVNAVLCRSNSISSKSIDVNNNNP